MSSHMSVYLMYGFMITDKVIIDKMWNDNNAWDKLLELDVVYDPSDIKYIAIGVHLKSFDQHDDHSVYNFSAPYDLDEELTDIIVKLAELYPFLIEEITDFKCQYMLFNNWA